MLYLAIPAHNEAATIGVLLWRLRTVLAEFPREYEAVVYDDASTDSTLDILQSYSGVMPLTVLRGERHVGYAGAIDALARYVSRQTRYPRRDAMLLLQGDFTDPPALVPEFAKRFEGGADIVVGERVKTALRTAPLPVRRLVRATPWLLRFFVGVQGVRDLTSSYRLVRISVLRDLLRSVGDAPVCAGDTTTANADLLLKLVPLARRVEAIPIEPTWDVRLRDTRIVAMTDGMALFRWGWRSRGRRAAPSTAPESANDTQRSARGARNDRDGRADSRNELRFDQRADSRGEAADGTTVPSIDIPRAPARDRTRTKTARPARNGEPPPGHSAPRAADRKAGRVVALEQSLDVTRSPDTDDAETDSGVQRPPRRKRSRGRRGDRNISVADSSTNDAPEANDTAGESAGTQEIILSSTLTDAIDDVESQSDGIRRSRSARKKRRRRSEYGPDVAGSGNEAVATESAQADDDTQGRTVKPLLRLDSQMHLPASNQAAPGEPEVVANDAVGDAVDHAVGDDAGDDTGDSTELPVRRRGRRGRRGGTRRSRSRIDGSAGAENSDGGEADNASPPSALHDLGAAQQGHARLSAPHDNAEAQ